MAKDIKGAYLQRTMPPQNDRQSGYWPTRKRSRRSNLGRNNEAA
jgi:hypothetical protein